MNLKSIKIEVYFIFSPENNEKRQQLESQLFLKFWINEHLFGVRTFVLWIIFILILIPLRYILVDIPCNDTINWWNKQLSQNSKLDIEIKRLRLTKLHTIVATSELGTIVLDTHNSNRLYDLYIHYGHTWFEDQCFNL